MSKAVRLREQTARQRIAAQRAAAQRRQARRRAFLGGGAILAVVAVVAGFLIARSLSAPAGGQAAAGGTRGTVLPAAVAREIESVPAATLSQAGAGPVPGYQNKTYSGAPVRAVTGPALTSGGKPDLLYIGAEFCPYCAAMRWSMAVALSRFGTFTTPLRGIHSAADDTDPSTPTLTFYQARYSSRYLSFTPVENEDENHQQLQATTHAQEQAWERYDTVNGQVGYPFIDFGNQAVITAPLYDPALLRSMTWAQVAAALRDPSSPAGQAIDGTANYVTAGICAMTSSKPAAACSPAPVRALEQAITGQ